MRTIYKYPIDLFRRIEIELPLGSLFCHFGKAPLGENAIWLEVDTDAPKLKYKFSIVGTGHPVPEDMVYAASMMDGDFMWHLYAMPQVIRH